jgi:hypothetical protein
MVHEPAPVSFTWLPLIVQLPTALKLTARFDEAEAFTLKSGSPMSYLPGLKRDLLIRLTNRESTATGFAAFVFASPSCNAVMVCRPMNLVASAVTGRHKLTARFDEAVALTLKSASEFRSAGRKRDLLIRLASENVRASGPPRSYSHHHPVCGDGALPGAVR